MNLSDPSGDDDSSMDEPSSKRKYSVDETVIPTKRRRADTYGTSSTTSHGSVLQESDDEPSGTTKYLSREQSINQFNSSEASADDNIRGSRSSLSENESSPNDRYDDYRPVLENNDTDNGESSMRPNFQEITDLNSSYKNQSNNIDDSYGKNYSDKSKRMMSNMGFKPGRGLGKREDGRVEPVEASTQKGRRGLGLKPSVVGNLPQSFMWNADDAKPEAEEKPTWISPAQNDTLHTDQLQKWLKKGAKKLNIDDETNFVDANVLKGILESKTIFDSLDDEDLRHARFRSNPYETIGSVMFLNRAAVKMANMDAVFGFMFTEHEKLNQNTEKKPDQNLVKEILYFADVCAGPGGFSEYVLYRKGWTAKGFGFTLKGRNDFKLSDFYAGTPETFHPYYGIKGDGDIFDPANLTSLKDHVMSQTNQTGVHFLMADGGFSVEGQENIQEILSKQLYLCQCLVALMIVRPGGHFVVKLFDVFTLFSVGLIYIMYKCFDQVSIHKPVTSRPANSERYLICKSKKDRTDSAEKHLFRANKILCDDDNDVIELVPLNIIEEDVDFYSYIYNSNCSLGAKQITNLLKIAEFSKNRSLKEQSQAQMRDKCLKLWRLPDEVRTQPKRLSPGDTLSSILTIITNFQGKIKTSIPHAHDPQAFKTHILNKPPEYLNSVDNLNVFKHVYDWHFMFLSSGKDSRSTLSIFIGCGGKQVFQLEDNGWKNVSNLQLTLPAKTLIYGEIVKEYKGEGSIQIHTKALHIIDAMILGGRDISRLHLTERINQCDLFCTALSNPTDTQALPIRCKKLYNMEEFSSVVENVKYRAMKRVKQAVTVDLPDGIDTDEKFYQVESILFMKQIKEPWIAQMSKKTGHKYYFALGKDNKPLSEYFIPTEAKLDMISAYTNRIMWPWEPAAATAILNGTLRNGVSKKDMLDYIKNNVGN
ncbi:cap-specific mRNA (nucleoside-2'-O-)-methyltransferase 1 [Achroia grisella]|uniref:cap-specific mRNA (nucleoside-2'-O-)-methyltransferase 1 n=1 Tax=Achroia grisella TaxID=688607 RepID=UPI0027D32A44|nr:cap-specific mRNA (nucleoside-2'-O-)-methyltransferase 1 [Achroia grisella]